MKESVSAAYQLRRYSWTAKLPIGILTDFEELAIYDCRIELGSKDPATVGRLEYFTFEEFEEKWDELVSIFSQSTVEAGSLDAYAEKAPTKGRFEVDKAFLREIESWRDALAHDIAKCNPDISLRSLNFAIQRTIDRIVFLRICEDRGIEPYGRLQELLSSGGVYEALKEFFVRADERYNSSLFHFRQEKGRPEASDDLSLKLAISDDVLTPIISRLYYPDSPYEFSVLPADILGQVYEQFLGRVIDLDDQHQVSVVEKPEVRKAGGVYYTPTFVVDFIINRTLGEQVSESTPAKVAKLRFLDPACGSGSFLIEAYQHLLDWHLAWYLEHDEKKHSAGKAATIYRDDRGTWRLTVHERKRILLDNIFGVDVDPQAVEVTKLSLLLKVLEGESEESLSQQMSLFHERALPDLGANIKCGNSLISPDFFAGEQANLFDVEQRYKINPFSWTREFPSVAEDGFDAVIGNPPYLNIRLLGQIPGSEVKDYFRDHYSCARLGYDLYVLFIEQSHRLLKKGGRFGMIVPNKLATLDYALQARKLLATDTRLEVIADLSELNVFPGASVYPYVICYSKLPPTSRQQVFVGKADHPSELGRSIGEQFVLQRDLDPVEGFMIHGTMEVEKSVSTKPLSGVAKLHSGTTGFAAQRLAEEISERSDISADDDVFDFVVSGSIDRYSFQLGDVRYMKRQFEMPVISRTSEVLTDNKRTVFANEKIIVAGMTKRLEVAWDRGGTALGVQVYAITEIACDPHYLVGIMNSKLLSYLFRLRFQAKHLAGGYLAINKGQLEKLPIRVIAKSDKNGKALAARISEASRSLGDLHRSLNSASMHERTAVERQIADVDDAIDQMVYQLYKLTDAEISEVEKLVAQYA